MDIHILTIGSTHLPPSSSVTLIMLWRWIFTFLLGRKIFVSPFIYKEYSKMRLLQQENSDDIFRRHSHLPYSRLSIVWNLFFSGLDTFDLSRRYILRLFSLGHHMFFLLCSTGSPQPKYILWIITLSGVIL